MFYPALRMKFDECATFCNPEYLTYLISRAEVLQRTSGGREAFNFLINEIGVEASFERDEGYWSEAVAYTLGTLSGCLKKPELMSQYIKNSNSMISSEQGLIYSDHQYSAIECLKSQTSTSHEKFIFIAQPRSASATLAHSIAGSLGSKVMNFSVGAFPDVYISPSWLQMFLDNFIINQDHISPNDFNVGVLQSKNIKKIVLSTRSPLDSALSDVVRHVVNTQSERQPDIKYLIDFAYNRALQYQGFISGWRAQGKNFKILEVQYDEIINSSVETIYKIFQHVSISLEKNHINCVDVHKSTSPPHWIMNIREALIDKDKNLSSY